MDQSSRDLLHRSALLNPPSTPHPRANARLSRRSLLGGIAGSVAVVVAGQPAWAVDTHRPGALRAPSLRAGDQSVLRQIRPAEALRHLRELSVGIGPRIGGTESEYAAAQYIAGRLDRAGCDVRLEPFPVADKFLADIGDPDDNLTDEICWQAGASPDAGLDVAVTGAGRRRRVRHGARLGRPTPRGSRARSSSPTTRRTPTPSCGCSSAPRSSPTPRPVAPLPSSCSRSMRRTRAAPRRLPCDWFRPSPGSRRPAPTPVASIPVVGVAQVQKRLLREDVVIRPLELTVSTSAHRNLTSHNVIGERPGQGRGSTSPLVYVGAHYDSVIGAPGANDDGSGTALTLELARVFGKLGKHPAGLRFALWGSEEQGLIGSRYHVAQLAQAERDRIRGAFNNDMVGTSWDPATRYWLLSFTGQGNATTDAVAAAADRLGYAPEISPVTERGASDHQSFQEVGIASANFSWRGEASPALLEPPYHSPEDTIERNISMDRLTVSMELIGCATHDLASQ